MSYIIDALAIIALVFVAKSALKEMDTMTDEEKEFNQTW